MIQILTYIILGVILATIGLTLLNGISETIELLFELLKARLAIKITKYNAQIKELASPQQDEETSAKAIGFTISTEEDDIDDE